MPSGRGLRSYCDLPREATFDVYVPDRRGRGKSGPPGDGYRLASECADVAALLRASGARRLFGLSSGALIALYCARELDGIDRLAVYEPPLSRDGGDPLSWVARYERELDRGALASAMVTVIQGTGDEELMTRLPRALLVPFLRVAIAIDARTGHGDDVPIRALIPTLRFDARLAREAAGLLPSFAAIGARTLLLGGDRSARFLRDALDALARTLPLATRVTLPRIGHLAADNSGRPADVARILREFFGEP